MDNIEKLTRQLGQAIQLDKRYIDFINARKDNEKDDELNYDTIMPQAVKLAEKQSDGKIYSLANFFSVVMPYTAKTTRVGDIEKWDISAMLDILESKPKDTPLYGGWVRNGGTEYQESRLSYIPLTCWLDFDEGECYFDSPEFLRLLKYAVAGDHYDENTYQTSEPSREEEARQITESQGGLMNDISIFTDVNLYDYQSYVKNVTGQFNYAPVTTLGELTYDGTGGKYLIVTDQDSFGINADSEYKEYAWEFIKYMFSDEYYGTNKFKKGYGEAERIR